MAITPQQALFMVEIQDAINFKSNPEWMQSASGLHLRTIVMRGAKSMELSGWERETTGLQQAVQIQLMLDIWSIVLTEFIVKSRGNLAYAASALVSASKPHTGVTGTVCLDGMEYRLPNMGLMDKLELMIGLAAAKRVSVPLVESILVECQSGWDDLYGQFLLRNSCTAMDRAISLSDS